jgi:hypothetical protein
VSVARAADDLLFENRFDGDLSRWTVVRGHRLVNDGVVEASGPGHSDLRTNREFSGDLLVEFTAAKQFEKTTSMRVTGLRTAARA